MIEVLRLVKSVYQSFCGTGMYFSLFFVALLYIALKKEEKEARYYFVYPSLFLLFIIFNPISAQIIGGYLVGWDVYWRVFWTLPFIAVIAYASTQTVNLQEKQYKKVLTQLAIIAIIILCGRITLNTELFSYPKNLYKIPNEVVEVADIILEDDKNPKMAAPLPISGYLRQYTGEIIQAYGRNAARGSASKSTLTIYEQLNADTPPDLKVLIKKVRKGKYKYLVVPIQWEYDAEFLEYKYEKLGCTNSYVIYKDTTL
ncbi:hypothetical protein [Anaerosacchariphilus polymeriproducens]|uniref:Uncharacterized protein n=1 Tax=Anaerosacchariphilus polymeriproducens TaxID=1812858 RepID=A0A371AR83_9FIRM|nr:hypothetical protein [Anaerosacchariphilus polymeriproducens]RDU22091.1 hypothetical protein DWV06_16305 [Anaerosacchariphilus polymeriproducens]